ncbi:conjugal transfer protein TraG [Clostridia bacterium]|nr:conjugal transfer protein TraG [Clostridia bacterium]
MKSSKLKQLILPNLPYLGIFWLFDKLGEAYRISQGSDVLKKLMHISTSLNSVFSRPVLSLDSFDLCIGIIGAATIFLAVLYKKKNAKNWRKDREYGSARWGTRKDIEPYVDPVPENNVILTATESLTMNGRPKNPKYARNKNVLIVGGSGSGKTRFFIKPNIMQTHSSYICTDPKGTILVECGKLLQRNKYEIKVLNTIDFKKSLHYNPFAYIRSEKDILKFTTALILNTKGEDSKGGEDFWQKAEVLLYCALIGFIYFEAPEEEQNMNTLVELINSMEVREEDESFKNAVDYMFEKLAKKEPKHFAVRQYAKYKLAAGKTAKSILISCGARLAPFDIAELREIMSFDEMNLNTIGDKKTALFIIISDTDTTFNFIAALMYSQLFNLLCDRADNIHHGTLPVHVRFLLDEFANIGQIPSFDKLIATIRSRNISACIVLQTLSQLKNMYKDNAETIQGNCDSRIFLGGSEKTTLKDLSESLGKETIYMMNHSESKGNSPSYSQSHQKLGKELMSADELSVLDGSKCILQLRGVRPFLSDKYDITRHKNYRHLSDFSERNVFDIAGYVSTKLKVDPNEQFLVLDASEINTEMPQEAFGDFETEQSADKETEFDPNDFELV